MPEQAKQKGLGIAVATSVKSTPTISKAKRQLREAVRALEYERSRMTAEITGAGYSESFARSIVFNAEIKPETVRKLVAKLDLDSKSLGAVRRCITNVKKLVSRIRPLKRTLEIREEINLNGI